MGNIGGTAEGGSCCTIHVFWARSNPAGFYKKIRWEKYLNEWSAYTMDAVGNHEWCYYVGEYRELELTCEGGLENHAKNLQVGVEVDDNTQPETFGWDETDGIWGNGEAHQWNFAVDRLISEGETVGYNGLCTAAYTPYDYAGNIYYGDSNLCP
jgi:hypothetical protein